MLTREHDIRHEALLDVAHKMALAARTAPKGKGSDLLEISIITGQTIMQISERMHQLGEEKGSSAMLRDSGNLANCSVLFAAGTRTRPLGITYCGLCGYENCAAQEAGPGGWCAFNTGDLGIAIGSAASIAADNRADNRIMYTVGMAMLDMKLMDPEVRIIYGIPLSATGKSIFFDRG